MANSENLELDGEPSNALVAAILDIRQTAIELGGALGLLAEHVALNRIVPAAGERPCDGLAKALEAFGVEVQMLYVRYKLTK